MNIKDFKDVSVEEMQETLNKQLEEFTADVKTINDIEKLKEMELDVDKEQEELDEYLRTLEYPLSHDDVVFDGKTYKFKDIATKIVYHLNRTEAEFQYCLGLHSLVLTWKNAAIDKISYGAYDSTLRLLGQLKFKGDNEWTDILVINNYLANLHDSYKKDRTMMIVLAEKRNAIVDRIQMVSPMEQVAE